MASDEEIQNALLAIHSRLGTIEGKVTLLARGDRDKLREALEKVIHAKPLIGQIYLLLDGKRSQRAVLEALTEAGVQASEATVSRRIGEMETEHGIADLVRGGAAKVYRKDRQMEDVLNLSRNIRKWLEADGHWVPPAATRRPRGAA